MAKTGNRWLLYLQQHKQLVGILTEGDGQLCWPRATSGHGISALPPLVCWYQHWLPLGGVVGQSVACYSSAYAAGLIQEEQGKSSHIWITDMFGFTTVNGSIIVFLRRQAGCFSKWKLGSEWRVWGLSSWSSSPWVRHFISLHMLQEETCSWQSIVALECTASTGGESLSSLLCAHANIFL